MLALTFPSWAPSLWLHEFLLRLREGPSWSLRTRTLSRVGALRPDGRASETNLSRSAGSRPGRCLADEETRS